MDEEKRTAILEKNLARLLSWVNSADEKASLLLVVETVMLAGITALAVDNVTWTGFSVFITSLSAVLILLTLISTTVVVFPRTKGPDKSLIYFNKISDMGVNKFENAIHSLTSEDYTEDLIKQNYVNAQIAKKKYLWLKRAMVLLYASIVPWAVTVYVLYRYGGGD